MSWFLLFCIPVLVIFDNCSSSFSLAWISLGLGSIQLFCSFTTKSDYWPTWKILILLPPPYSKHDLSDKMFSIFTLYNFLFLSWFYSTKYILNIKCMLPAFVWDLNFMNKHFLITNNFNYHLRLDCNFAIQPSLVKLS